MRSHSVTSRRIAASTARASLATSHDERLTRFGQPAGTTGAGRHRLLERGSRLLGNRVERPRGRARRPARALATAAGSGSGPPPRRCIASGHPAPCARTSRVSAGGRRQARSPSIRRPRRESQDRPASCRSAGSGSSGGPTAPHSGRGRWPARWRKAVRRRPTAPRTDGPDGPPGGRSAATATGWSG